MLRRSVLPVVVFLLMIPPLAVARQEAEWPVPRGASQEPEPYVYEASSWQSVPRSFLDDAPACALHIGTTILVRRDGTTDSVHHEVLRFNGRKSIEEFGEYRGITFEPPFESVTLHLARVHKADGRSIDVKPRHLQVRDLNTDFSVYDHAKTVVVSFPSLEVGDVIEVNWTCRSRNPEYQGQFFSTGSYRFGHPQYPVVHECLRIRMPRDWPLRHTSVNADLPAEIEETGSYRTFRWRQRNLERLPAVDHLPPADRLWPEVVYSTFESWQQVWEWEQNLVRDCSQCPPELTRLVDELTRGKNSQGEKASALTQWVRRNIRYLSIGEKHHFTPHSPEQVLAQRFGDCKDQCHLLMIMMRRAGLRVGAVTLGIEGDGQLEQDVPSPWGSHAILRVTLEDGDHWVDPTANLAGWDVLPRVDCGRRAFVTDSKGIELVSTPALDPSQDRTEHDVGVQVLSDGTCRLQYEEITELRAAMYRRDDWQEVPRGEREQKLRDWLLLSHGKMRLEKFVLDEHNLRRTDEPVLARWDVTVPEFFLEAGDEEERGLTGHFRDEMAWDRFLHISVDPDRPVPLYLAGLCETTTHYRIQFPFAYRLRTTPLSRRARSRWGEYALEVHAPPHAPHRLELTFRLSLTRLAVEPEQLEEFLAFQEEVQALSRATLTLVPTVVPADILPLELQQYPYPLDPVAVRVLAKLYQQQQQPAHARRVLQTALALHPEERALWTLLQEVASSPTEEDGVYQAMLRRFPLEVELRLDYAGHLLRRREPARAREVLQPLTGDFPVPSVRARAHLLLARSHQAEPREALAQLRLAQKAAPAVLMEPAALRLEAEINSRLQDDEAALRAWNAFLRAEPESAEALAAVTELHLKAGRQEDALQTARRLTVAAESDPPALLRAAELHLRLNRLDDARDLAHQALRWRESAAAHRILALAASAAGDPRAALPHCPKADDTPGVRLVWMRGLLREGRFEEAVRLAHKPADELPPSPDLQCLSRLVLDNETQFRAAPEARREAVARVLCARIGRQEGWPPSEVMRLVDDALAKEPALAPALALKSVLTLQTGRLYEARRLASRALKSSADEPLALMVDAVVRIEQGDWTALAPLSAKLRETTSPDPVVVERLRDALQAAGRMEEATQLPATPSTKEGSPGKH